MSVREREKKRVGILIYIIGILINVLVQNSNKNISKILLNILVK